MILNLQLAFCPSKFQISPPNSTALSIQTGNGWPPVLVGWNASQPGPNSNQNMSKKQVPWYVSNKQEYACHKKIPTDHWNIPQTLSHLFEYGNPSRFHICILGYRNGYVPRGLLEAHGSAQMESHGLRGSALVSTQVIMMTLSQFVPCSFQVVRSSSKPPTWSIKPFIYRGNAPAYKKYIVESKILLPTHLNVEFI